MICKTFILTKSDISSHIHIMYIQSAKESIEYKVVTSKRRTTESADINRQKRRTKCQRFAKLKEVFCQRTCRHKNTTFNFAQPHPKPTHHPTSGRLTIWRQLLTETGLKN
jgi:hypothetical protein